MLNDSLAAVVARELREQPDKCVKVESELASPVFIRHNDGKWSLSGKWVSHWGLQPIATSNEDVIYILANGDAVELYDSEDVPVWENSEEI